MSPKALYKKTTQKENKWPLTDLQSRQGSVSVYPSVILLINEAFKPSSLDDGVHFYLQLTSTKIADCTFKIQIKISVYALRDLFLISAMCIPCPMTERGQIVQGNVYRSGIWVKPGFLMVSPVHKEKIESWNEGAPWLTKANPRRGIAVCYITLPCEQRRLVPDLMGHSIGALQSTRWAQKVKRY